MIQVDLNDAQLQRQVQGLIRSYRQLPKDVAKKYLRKAMRRALKPFEPALKGNTPYYTGNLLRSIQTKVRVYDKPGSGAVAGVSGYVPKTLRKKRGQFVITGSGSHAIIVERGTNPRKTSSGRACGSMPALRIMERTLSSAKGPIMSTLMAELAAGLEKAAKERGDGAP